MVDDHLAVLDNPEVIENNFVLLADDLRCLLDVLGELKLEVLNLLLLLQIIFYGPFKFIGKIFAFYR